MCVVCPRTTISLLQSFSHNVPPHRPSKFTNAYAGYTVCAPSRTTLMTGYHSGHFPAQNLAGTNIPASQDIPLLGTMLQNAGYATASIGKVAPLASPTTQGFDHFIGQVDQGLCHNMYPRSVDSGASAKNVNLTGNWEIPSTATAARTACMADPSSFNYTVDITHEQSMAWVRQQAAARDADGTRKPFFLYEAFTVPVRLESGHWTVAIGCIACCGGLRGGAVLLRFLKRSLC